MNSSNDKRWATRMLDKAVQAIRTRRTKEVLEACKVGDERLMQVINEIREAAQPSRSAVHETGRRNGTNNY
jgi:hypothetical protein